MAEYWSKQLSPTDELPTKLKVDRGGGSENDVSANGSYTTTTAATSQEDKNRHQNGRRFHGFEEDAYFLPNDAVETARLDLQHHCFKFNLNGHLSVVPITKDMKQILDLGTGTGIWCLEIAKENPQIQVTGTDLSAIQPSSKPSNCNFIVANAEHDWPFDSKFDFIHSRMLTMGMHDWPRYFKQCWDNLQPGGWIQTMETRFPQRRADEESQHSSPMIQWGQYCYDAAAKNGVDTRASMKFDEILKAQGFVSIESWDIQWPIGPWPQGKKNKILGSLVKENLLKGIPGFGAGLLQGQLGWSKEKADEFSAEVVEDLETGHYYCPIVCHRAQKPHN